MFGYPRGGHGGSFGFLRRAPMASIRSLKHFVRNRTNSIQDRYSNERNGAWGEGEGNKSGGKGAESAWKNNQPKLI
jgi:hypothetical protein